MDDSRALVGLLDRLAEVRRVDATRARPTTGDETSYGSEFGRGRFGSAAVQRDGLRLVQGGAGFSAGGSSRQSRDAMVDDCVRRTFVLLNEFRDAFKLRADPHWLGILLRAISQDATYTFEVAAKVRRESPEFSADKARCLADLEQLHHALRSPNLPSEPDLAHAMDALIVQLVRVQTGP